MNYLDHPQAIEALARVKEIAPVLREAKRSAIVSAAKLLEFHGPDDDHFAFAQRFIEHYEMVFADRLKDIAADDEIGVAVAAV